MLGDDPDPTVTMFWVGFGEVSDAGEGFEYCAKRVKRSGNNRMVGLRKVNKDKEEAATNNGCTFYENMQMQCA